LYLKATDQLSSVPLVGTEGASRPFFSPDGKSIGFFADQRLKKVTVTW
jgi:hypothetical protein